MKRTAEGSIIKRVVWLLGAVGMTAFAGCGGVCKDKKSLARLFRDVDLLSTGRKKSLLVRGDPQWHDEGIRVRVEGRLRRRG